MTGAEYKPCDPSSRRLCKTLHDRTHAMANARRAGIHVLQLMNMETGTFRTLGPVFRTSAKDRGLVLNFCPWCGADWRPIYKLDEEAAEVGR